MSFSSRRRNYLLTPHRRDGLIEWMKSMLVHSFVLDALDTTGADTFSHFEMLIEEHRRMETEGASAPSRLKQLVPTVGTFHTCLPLCHAFEAYNEKHKLTKRRHVTISFNEIRHILNLAQIMAMRKEDPSGMDSGLREWTKSPVVELPDDDDDDHEKEGPSPDFSGKFNGPKMITFDGDQTLYSDGSNFESNPRLANYLCRMLQHGVIVAVVTAAGYEYRTEKYEYRLSGLLAYFKQKNLTEEECERFFLFGGECNYLLHLGSDYRLHPVKEVGAGGWQTSTLFMKEAPGNWNEDEVQSLLHTAENSMNSSKDDQNLRARVLCKRRAVGLIPNPDSFIPREALDEAVLRVQAELQQTNSGRGPTLPFCAFNGGRDVWVDVGNKRVGVQVLQSYLGIPLAETLHIGDQFLNTGNDFAARDVCPCIWITSPEETTYILKSILRLAGVDYEVDESTTFSGSADDQAPSSNGAKMDFSEIERRSIAVQNMDVYTGEVKKSAPN